MGKLFVMQLQQLTLLMCFPAKMQSEEYFFPSTYKFQRDIFELIKRISSGQFDELKFLNEINQTNGYGFCWSIGAQIL